MFVYDKCPMCAGDGVVIGEILSAGGVHEGEMSCFNCKGTGSMPVRMHINEFKALIKQAVREVLLEKVSDGLSS